MHQPRRRIRWAPTKIPLGDHRRDGQSDLASHLHQLGVVSTGEALVGVAVHHAAAVESAVGPDGREINRVRGWYLQHEKSCVDGGRPELFEFFPRFPAIEPFVEEVVEVVPGCCGLLGDKSFDPLIEIVFLAQLLH